jgi:hypothetical protein
MADNTNSLDRLNGFNFNLVHNDPMQEVNGALAACNTALQDWHQTGQGPRPMSVCPKVVAYTSVNQRNQQFNLYLQRNPQLAGQYADGEWEDEKRAYGIMGDAVAGANQRNCIYYMVSMQNPVFSHGWHMRHFGGQDTPQARAEFYTGDNEWHEFVLLLNQRVVSA